MCTVVIHRDPAAYWPLILAANRDEMAGRPWRPPARHWDGFPHVVAGLDEEAGGTWLGINDDGLVAAVLNRPGSLGPQAGKRSRGELPLEALGHAEAREAAQALAQLDSRAYRSFNMIVADIRDAFWIRSEGDTSDVSVEALGPGLSMLTAHDLNDVDSARIGTYLPIFAAAPVPDPDKPDWTAWQRLMGSRNSATGPGERGAMNVGKGGGFGTICSSLIALPGVDRFGRKPQWLFAAGAPDMAPFEAVDLGA